MLKRKIIDTLLQWKNTTGHKPLVIMGIRQCGKTFIAQHFAANNYRTVVYMQFLLDLEPEEIILEPIDTDALNKLAKEILG